MIIRETLEPSIIISYRETQQNKIQFFTCKPKKLAPVSEKSIVNQVIVALHKCICNNKEKFSQKCIHLKDT